jgi:hypothetical protein
VASLKGLAFGSLISGLGLLALSAPAEAILQCQGIGAKFGETEFGTATTGSGKNCGFLGAGGDFSINVTDFFTGRLGTEPFDMTQFGVGIITAGTSQVSFSNVQAVVNGTVFGNPFAGPIAIWGEDLGSAPMGIGDPAPFGSALGANFSYQAFDDEDSPLGAFRGIDFSFNNLGVGGFGSWKASPDQIQLTAVESFLITGRLESVGTGDPSSTNIISFAVGPGGFPAADNDFATIGTFGGYFTTQVPGPLPLAGVGAAFAWSRKLRRKQKADISH